MYWLRYAKVEIWIHPFAKALHVSNSHICGRVAVSNRFYAIQMWFAGIIRLNCICEGCIFREFYSRSPININILAWKHRDEHHNEPYRDFKDFSYFQSHFFKREHSVFFMSTNTQIQHNNSDRCIKFVITNLSHQKLFEYIFVESYWFISNFIFSLVCSCSIHQNDDIMFIAAQ